MNNPKKTVHFCFCVQLSFSHVQQTDKSDLVPAYKSFFSGIQALEKLPLTVYASGTFLEWQKGKRQAAYAILLNEMVSRKQIELLGGGYYDPYFPVIPPSDVVGQIELMTSALRTSFGKRPRGLFLTASAWAPSLITAFHKCGMEYCLLDYRFFPHSEAKSLCFTPAMLEDNGKTITAFPYIPDDPDFMTRSPQEFYDKIAGTASETTETVCLLFLPVSVYTGCMEKNKDGSSWFSVFIEKCSASDSIVRLTHTEELLKHRQPLSPVYIPPNTVLCGQLTGHSAKQIITGKRDSFRLYTKMMYVNMLTNGMKGDKARKKCALQEFWKAQNAEFFTIEPCTSFYHRYLRRMAYRKLLVAEKQTRLPAVFADGLSRYDIDLDGCKEILSQRTHLNMYVHHYGGKIFECDVFAAYKNYADLPVENAGMFIDHLLTGQALQELQAGRPESLPAVFSENTYQEMEMNTIRSELKLSSSGFFDTIRQPVSLRKQYTFFGEGAQVQYILKNDSPFNLSAYFAVEVDIALEGTETLIPSLSLYDCETNQKQECSITTDVFNKVSWVQLEDPEGKIQFTMEANEVPGLVVIPVYTPCADTHEVCEHTNCGVRIFFYWKTDLNPGYETEKMLFLKIKNKKN
ncbi:MAG: DUF1926 domain-containing protein [Treponema sp.]